MLRGSRLILDLDFANYFAGITNGDRKAIYTTNAIESMNMTLCKVLRNHRSFPTDDSALKVVFMAINNISKKWTMPIKDWKAALERFAIEFEGRFTA
jgi:putative transposase